jgi:hypothetical protein
LVPSFAPAKEVTARAAWSAYNNILINLLHKGRETDKSLKNIDIKSRKQKKAPVARQRDRPIDKNAPWWDNKIIPFPRRAGTQKDEKDPEEEPG